MAAGEGRGAARGRGARARGPPRGLARGLVLGLVLGLAAALALGRGAEGARPPKVMGVVAAANCSWAPAPGGGGGGVLELSGVRRAEIFAVSPKRSTSGACLCMLKNVFGGKAPRKRPNAALTAWPAGRGAPAGAKPLILLGAVADVEVKPSESVDLSVRVEQSAAQLGGSGGAAGAGPLASCSLLLGEQRFRRRARRRARGAPAPGPAGPAGARPAAEAPQDPEGVLRGSTGGITCATGDEMDFDYCTPDGSINVTVTGGIGPFNYDWSNDATVEDLNGLTWPNQP